MAHVSRGMISKIERGQIAAVPLRVLRAVAAALGASLELRLRWHGEGLDRLLDEAHARVVDATVVLLREAGWDAAVEASFSIWGERGSIDSLAWHAATGSLLVIEVKSVVPDSQATLHGLDRKARLAPPLAEERGWECRNVGRLLVLAESRTSRRRVAALAATYDTALADRNVEVRRWIRKPTGPLAGLLFLTNSSPGSTKRASMARERVRRPSHAVSRADSRPMPPRERRMTKITNCRPPEMRIALPTKAYDKNSRAGVRRAGDSRAERHGATVRAWLTDQGAPAMLRQPIGRIDRACARNRSRTRRASWPRARRRKHETLGLGR
jgi:transcriptional regulator with XRE-family HTH domain